MGQRAKILTQIAGWHGWRVADARWEDLRHRSVVPIAGYDVPDDAVLILTMRRRWSACCGSCGTIVPASRCHQRRKVRRWQDLPWGAHRVEVEYRPERYKCSKCGGHATEKLAWAEPKQRQTSRLQQWLALDAFSMPLLHVATKYGLSWHTIRRAEVGAIDRWERTRPPRPLRMVGVDEKWLGRRHKRDEKFVTIASDLETGEPLWIGYGRSEATLKIWIDTLPLEQKAAIVLFAMDMHRAFLNAVRADPALQHTAIVHDPFHVMKRAGEAISELRRAAFFRAGPELRAVGRGARWLVLRAWEKMSDDDRAKLRKIFAVNGQLARAYQVVEELRAALKAPDLASMSAGLWHVLYRTEKRANVPMRKLHDSLLDHFDEIVALGEHHPPTGRIEALNTNWEALVRRGRGHRDHQHLLRKLRFITANPVRTGDGVRRFLALGITPPFAQAA
jgi:transposase